MATQPKLVANRDLVVVGVLARIEVSEGEHVRRRLARLEGVETFELQEPEKLGILIEAQSVDLAHRKLLDEVEKVEGVLGVWPVSLETDYTEAPKGPVGDAEAD